MTTIRAGSPRAARPERCALPTDGRIGETRRDQDADRREHVDPANVEIVGIDRRRRHGAERDRRPGGPPGRARQHVDRDQDERDRDERHRVVRVARRRGRALRRARRARRCRARTPARASRSRRSRARSASRRPRRGAPRPARRVGCPVTFHRQSSLRDTPFHLDCSRAASHNDALSASVVRHPTRRVTRRAPASACRRRRPGRQRRAGRGTEAPGCARSSPRPPGRALRANPYRSRM